MHIVQHTNLDSLRLSINTATVALAQASMVDGEAAEELAHLLSSTVPAAFAALPSVDEAGKDAKGPVVQALQLQDMSNSVQKRNPMVFAHPFAVGPVPCDTAMAAKDYLSSLCAVAVFNLALASHTQAYEVSSASDSNDLLEQAKEYYRQAHNLLSARTVVSPNSSLIQVYLALSNTSLNYIYNLVKYMNQWNGKRL